MTIENAKSVWASGRYPFSQSNFPNHVQAIHRYSSHSKNESIEDLSWWHYQMDQNRQQNDEQYNQRAEFFHRFYTQNTNRP